ncbi:cytochrome c [Flavobacteriaceae bacterium F89]|uniref:Cytochrome c n=1 Tax=Cerina litoralis TaxID=2874477 RepID=A0AAE3JNS7_9FLAO|nr:cytochrome c [Cerina litoralis]MCG2460231.1 cytochrome c [Cerina litoralis]
MGKERCSLSFLFGMFCLLAVGQKDGVANIEEYVAQGKVLYAEHCLSCHQEDGGGAGNMNPPLIQTSYVLGDRATLIKVLLNGMSQEEIDGESYYNVMPSFSYLTDTDIAHVLTYVRNSFGNNASAITVEDVAEVRKEDDKR